MTPDPRKLAISEHQRWMGYLQPDGLVVSPLALVDAQVQLDTGSYTITQERFLDALTSDPDTGALGIPNFAFFARNFLGWRDELLSIFSVSAEVPDGLKISTGEHGEMLEPSAAYKFFQPADPARPYLLLVKQLPPGTLLDQVPDAKQEKGWVATPHQKFERLLRESGIHLGVLCNGSHIRLTYAPKGENSGSLTFPVAFMTETAGRILPAALDLLLSHRRLNTVLEPLRLPALLRKSRDYQAHVSTALSHQVLEALFELGRGFQTADEKAKGTLLADVWEKDPQQIYGGLITTLLRLVFLLYAEDRGLMPGSELYLRGYSVQGLFDQLRTDTERYPDHMDERFAAWPRLLALFRAVHGGCRHREMTLPARQGHLFDPDRFAFLEGRSSSNQQSAIDNQQSSLPLVSDGALHRILDLLLYLDGERLSYRTLDVEQIGSVYETIMGFAVEKAPGKMIALKPKKKHGAPVHVSLGALLAAKPADREKILLEQADTKLPDAAGKALKSASSEIDLLAALDKRIDRRATPHPVPAGSIILQPTDERRRSGSHYTPRSFTEPIVRKTLEPILDRLGRHPQPEAILDLKIADIAVGSAAFLVETCRQLAKELCSSWRFHDCRPVIPPDEDEDRHAMRLVAQRCLYGVDRNPMAVDLAKLSLWLATMARDHPFTFLDHAIKCGDSLVGLTNRQIADFHWFDRDRLKRELDAAVEAQDKKEIKRIKGDLAILQTQAFGQQEMGKLIERVVARRREIIADPEDTEYAILRKQARLAEADAAAQSIKTTGDLVIAAFFAGSKPRERQQFRDQFLEKHLALQRGQNVAENLPWQTRTLRELRSGEHPIRPFHWEIEFPEVFSRENPGFDGIVGNPPFLGGKKISGAHTPAYLAWIKAIAPGAGGQSDLVAYFFRRAFEHLRSSGSLGLIATNTIYQGDTRTAGLTPIVLAGGSIFAAQKRHRWPGLAVVIVSVVHIVRGIYQGKVFLNEQQVDRITAFLLSMGPDEDPARLSESSGRCFKGVMTGGSGFLFDDESTEASPLSIMATVVADSPSAQERVLPYLGGDEILSHPEHLHRRFVADFFEVPTDEFARWPALVEHVKARVTEQRGTGRLSDLPWWQFERPRPALRQKLRKVSHIFVQPFPSSYLNLARVPSTTLVATPHCVFTTSSLAFFSTLQSRTHEAWVYLMGSSLKDDLRYTPTDSFETFPFPSDWEENATLEEAGKTYYEYRAELMVRHDEGLTKTYNRFHDPGERSPDILRLRELHAAMDRAVLDAYGWTDIPTDCQFLLDYEEDDEDDTETTGKKARKKKKPWRYRWPDDIRDEVLARLLALNAERAEQEKLAGVGKKAITKKAAKKSTVRKTAASPKILEPVLAGLQDRPWETAIEQLEIEIPTRRREPVGNPLAYYRILVPALVQRAGGSLSLDLLYSAAALFELPDELLTDNDDLPDTERKRWREQFRETASAEAFGTAIRSLAADGKRIRIVGPPANLEVRNELTEPITVEWILADAGLALKAARRIELRGQLADAPAELVTELARHARTA